MALIKHYVVKKKKKKKKNHKNNTFKNFFEEHQCSSICEELMGEDVAKILKEICCHLVKKKKKKKKNHKNNGIKNFFEEYQCYSICVELMGEGMLPDSANCSVQRKRSVLRNRAGKSQKKNSQKRKKNDNRGIRTHEPEGLAP